MVFSGNAVQMFKDESAELKVMIDVLDSDCDVSVPEIVKVYHKVINVSSMSVMFRQQGDSDSELLEQIIQTEKMISERFDSVVHPKIMGSLSASIQKMTVSLQSGNSVEKSKDAESDAKLFEELRQSMSTKEFVEQYQVGLSHD